MKGKNMDNPVITDQGVQTPATPVVVAATPQATGASEQITNPPVVPAAEEQMIPKQRLDSVLEKQRAAEEKAALLEQYIQLVQANQSQQPPAQPAAPVQSSYERALNELGLQSEEYLSTSQQVKVLNKAREYDEVANQARQQQMNAFVSQQTFITQHPDYYDVVGTVNPITRQFVMAEPLNNVIKKNPQLAIAIQSSPYAMQLAYQLASQDPDYITSKATKGLTPEQKASAAAAAAIKAAGSPLSIGVVPGGGTIDKITMIRNMTDDQFKVYLEQQKAKAV